MNLVSKEFVAARTDNRGTLILSQFTGAARELRDALIVNPYDIDQIADTIHQGLTMDAREQEARMARLREVLEEHNIYRWAGSLVGELGRVHPEPAPAPPPASSG
jgi:trehalose 6-phosphate synthase